MKDRTLFLAALGLLIGLLIYLSIPKQIYHVTPHVSHDDEVWYLNGESTCVCYGEEGNKCDYTRCVCAGGKDYGSPLQQLRLVEEAKKDGGELKECPLIHLT